MAKPQFTYDRIADPNLDRLQDSIVRGMDSIVNGPKYPFGFPTDVKRDDYRAKWEDLVVCDNSDVSINVYLPTIEKQDLGRFVTVTNISSGASVVVKPTSGDLIQGSDYDYTINSDIQIYVAIAIGNWQVVT